MEIKVLKNIMDANEQIAARNRATLDGQKIFAVNIMASPGAGKTSLVIQTIGALGPGTKVGVIEGDISSSIDAETVSKAGVPVIQINTGGQCHLDANMIQNALTNLPLADIKLLLIENVGNLVCPAEFKLGESLKVLVASVPEGDDKPHKYPMMFSTVDVVILNKIDLIPYVKFNTRAFVEAVRGINANLEIFPVSCTTKEGISSWTKWLENRISRK